MCWYRSVFFIECFVCLTYSLSVILDAIDDLFKEEVDSMEKDARKNRILRVTSSCKHGLEVLGDLCLPPVKPRWADLSDAGPGVGVSNYEVRFRDAELARVHNSD